MLCSRALTRDISAEFKTEIAAQSNIYNSIEMHFQSITVLGVPFFEHTE